jgi:hypothetical protein
MSPNNPLHSDGPSVASPDGERGRWAHIIESPQYLQ